MNRITGLVLALSIVSLLALLLALVTGAPAPVHAGPGLVVAAGAAIKVPDDFPTIQAAINAANEGETILVAAGLYPENLVITRGLTLSGGWDNSFIVQTAGASVIDGQGLGRVISITCASSDTVVVVDGFTIQNGDATGLGHPLTSPRGDFYGTEFTPTLAVAADPLTPAEHAARLRARLDDAAARGLYPGGPAAYQAALAQVDLWAAQLQARASSPIADRSKQAEGCGGGVYSWNASLYLTNCTIQDNVASTSGAGYGGGVFIGQAALFGTTIADNTVQRNIASVAGNGQGGGVYIGQAPGAVLQNNRFKENAATNAGAIGLGGGLMADDNTATLLLANEFQHNVANASWSGLFGLGGGAYLRGSNFSALFGNVFRGNLAALHSPAGGGGLYLFNMQVVSVNENHFTGNWACFAYAGGSTNGGGLGLDTVYDVQVTENAIWGNTASGDTTPFEGGHGGGLWGGLCWKTVVASNTITGNLGSHMAFGRGGGAFFIATDGLILAGNAFADNVGTLSDIYTGLGGGLHLRNTTGSLVQGNVIRGNRAGTDAQGLGGGLCVEGWGPYSFDATVDGNLILDNRANANPAALNQGGGCDIHWTAGVTLTNNVVAGNAAAEGAGMALNATSGVRLVNNTVAGNAGTGIMLGAQSDPAQAALLVNNVIVSHTVGISVTQHATATVRYTLYHGNGTNIGGLGNFTHLHPVLGAPGFRDPAAHDYHLTPASAARDAGDPAGVPPAPAYDADGMARPQGPRVDIGAYEWRGHWLYLPLAFRQYQPVVGWAVGDSSGGYGTILHTTDGGVTWVRQGSPADVPDTQLKEVSAVDAQHAWVVGATAILRTRDGGQTWEQQVLPPNLPRGFELMGIKALDADNVYVVGWPSVLLHTTDGVTWSQMPRGADIPGNVAFQVVDAVDPSHVWAVGATMVDNNRQDPVIAFYNGSEWHLQPTTTLTNPLTTAVIGVSAIDPLHAWAVGGWSMPLATTADGGATWQVTAQPLSAGDMNRVVAVSPTTGWVSGDYGVVKYTTDGGATWYDVNVPSAFLLGVTALDDQTAWVVGPGLGGTPPGIIARTRDAQHWEVQSDPAWPNLNGISFVGARR